MKLLITCFACAFNIYSLLFFISDTEKITDILGKMNLKAKIYSAAAILLVAVSVMYSRIYLVFWLLFEYLGMTLIQYFLIIFRKIRKTTVGYRRTLMITLAAKGVGDIIWLYICIGTCAFKNNYMLLAVGCLALLFSWLIDLREKRVKKQCYLEFLQEKEAEISELAYKDLVTGVFNRNYFEQEKNKIDVKNVTALVSVSINHVEYFKSKYGIFYTENIVRAGVAVMKKCAPEEIKICRVSENIFYFWFTKPVQLEVYIQDIKDMFQKKGEDEDAVGKVKT